MNFQDRKITAKVERIVYPRADALVDGVSAFYIVRSDVGTIKGKLSHIPKTDECLTLDGKWEVSSFNGQPEFIFYHASVFVPQDERSLLKYACEMTKGFGPALEDKIWDKCGNDWRKVRFADNIPGLTAAKLAAFQDTIRFLEINAEQTKAVAWLCSIGCTLKMAEAAFEKWKVKTIALVQDDCYILAKLPTYGFSDIDSHIRPHFNIGRNDERRITACLNYYIAQLTQEDTVVSWLELYSRVSKAIDADPRAISDCCRRLFDCGKLIAFPKTQRLCSTKNFIDESIVWKAALEVRYNGGIKARQPIGSPFRLDETQMDAVQFALDHSLSIINGGAGCGKTTLIKAICDSLGTSVNLCAFAGKAAARLKEATGHDAGTIHRMLHYMGEEQGFTLKSLTGTTVVLDEASMVSSDLMAEIVKRNPARLILVGDEAQLPPVGSGQPFHDLIAKKPEIVKTLTTCYRNKEAIFQSAIAIRNGIMPPPNAKSEQELWDVRGMTDPRAAHRAILDVVRRGEIDFDSDIILCCRNGEKDGDNDCSVIGFNQDIKDIVNPNTDGSYRITATDRIINTKNCADLDVWNGTTGRCRDYDTDGAMWVDLDFPKGDGEREVLIPKKQVKDWQLAYALTVHKSQGSQYRKIFFVVAKRDAMTLLSRPMVYTAVTRAKRECRVIGDTQSFHRAIGTVNRKATVIQELAES